MINFTVGPVQTEEKIRLIGAEPTPYFRTREFSKIMLENEKMMLDLVGAPMNSRTVFLTGSGTASMEAAVLNTLDKNTDKALVVNGGSFGARWVELCCIYEIPYTEIKLTPGKTLQRKELAEYSGKGYTTFLVNLHETSTGVLYDLKMMSEFCFENQLFFIVDAISSFLADEINMKESNIDIFITGAQKALAVQPGVSIMVLSSKAIERIERLNAKCLYLNLKAALQNGERGQTPFTPAVTILLQIHARLKNITKQGIDSERKRIAMLAEDFRTRITKLPFDLFAETPSNAVTAICPKNASAYDIFLELKDKYGIWVCPNGGELADKVLRVGHIGDLSIEDNTKLIEALQDMYKQRRI